jgi:hypothetical protein
VARDREKEKEKQKAFSMSGHAESLAHNPQEMTRVLKGFISSKPVFILRNQVFCVVAPCDWVISSRRFEGTYRLYLQDYEFVN